MHIVFFEILFPALESFECTDFLTNIILVADMACVWVCPFPMAEKEGTKRCKHCKKIPAIAKSHSENATAAEKTAATEYGKAHVMPLNEKQQKSTNFAMVDSDTALNGMPGHAPKGCKAETQGNLHGFGRGTRRSISTGTKIKTRKAGPSSFFIPSSVFARAFGRSRRSCLGAGPRPPAHWAKCGTVSNNSAYTKVPGRSR